MTDMKDTLSKADIDDVCDDVELILEGIPSLEASLHYAALQRLREDDMSNVPQSQRTSFMTRMFAPKTTGYIRETTHTPDAEKPPATRLAVVSEEEKRMAQRALRTTTWVGVFYLITTDILGPFSTGWAFSQVVSTVVVANAQGLSQISKGRVCFSVLAVIWMLLGMSLGQIRSLKNFGAAKMKMLTFCRRGAIAHSPPNYASALAQNNVSPGPIIVKAIINQPFAPQLVGVMQMVLSYGGAMLFVELMVEMKRPFDFWKAMLCAQLIIVTIYMVFGIYVYAFQGQFTINPANQGISIFALQTVGNALTFVSGLITAALYGNIGIKIAYTTFIEEFFHGPKLVSRSGRLLWTIMVISYWVLAFVIASSVPQFSNINGIVTALCVLQFTYTFPPILYVGFIIQRDAIQGQPEFTPGANINELRRDTWRDLSRWRRGFAKRWWLNLFNIFLGLAGLALAGLGAFSSIEGIITTFKTSGSATSFGCKSPV
ncbi:hypothetical protein Clacol_003381 [Clathrus columnatus]|uniref:Amino acid transporter transmembrane domain-containing protein n=1 Tax=Clathrus columnatus TaxID=1419009 RepID=A0AAV5A8U4_9AGAM|nr:hypothetical protein Clacol_003381 [Clathrus columnatus]